MFPTFISILDIQSWWEVPSVAHFCSLFRTAFNLLDFDIEDLEEALLTDGTEESSWLQELIVRLLSGCLPNNEISTFNYQMFLRRLFRQKCQEHDQYNPFNTDIDFQLLPLRTKVDILHALCDFRLDADDVLDRLKNLEADSLRVEPLGYDDNQSAYWYFYGTRLYREDFKNKNSKKEKSIWQVICFTEDDWFQLAKKFKKSVSKAEKQLFNTLTENFLPELPRLFREKERLARKRLLESQPRRTSSRIRKQELVAEQEEAARQQLEAEKEAERLREEKEKQNVEKRRREAYERRTRLKEQSDTQSDNSDNRYDMAGAKTRAKKSKTRGRQNSESSASSKDHGSVFSNASNRSSNRGNRRTENKTAENTTTVGRQTNNSLACATGQIVIQPVANTHRKKLKTSQVFRQTDEDLQTGMHKILDHVKNHSDAWPFVDPVDEEYAPNYYSVIRKPMDLQSMEERLERGYYKTFTKFRDDFQLIVDNCRLYNGADNEYTKMVDNLQKVFERTTGRYLDEITSTDEEIAVEYPDQNKDGKLNNKRKKSDSSSVTKRKPTLAAETDDRTERSPSMETCSKGSEVEEPEEKVIAVDTTISTNTTTKKHSKKENQSSKSNKKHQKNKSKSSAGKNKIDTGTTKRKNQKNSKTKKVPKTKSPSPVRSRAKSFSRSPSRERWSSSPPPSWPPSSPDSRFDFSPRRNKKKGPNLSDGEKSNNTFAKHDKWKEVYKEDFDMEFLKENSPSPPKHKDKHNKLRETIEKLKAKSDFAKKIKEKESKDERMKENKDDNKSKNTEKTKHKNSKPKNAHKPAKNTDHDEVCSTADSIQSDSKKQDKKNSTGNNGNTTSAKTTSMEALTLATEQTLKDINKWLDDTPKFSEFSSASNSPSHFSGLDDFDIKLEQDIRKKSEKIFPKKEAPKEKKKPFSRDPAKFFRRREVQRTIDRLQPGKSKGNLISNIQNANKPDELFPLGPLSKAKDTKNSLIVKTDDTAPKLSLGSVLDSFGAHKFVDDPKKEGESKEEDVKEEIVKTGNVFETKTKEEEVKVEDSTPKTEKDPVKIGSSPGKATPNLSAWFKAFGAPKVQPAQKKTDPKSDAKEEKTDEKKDEIKKIVPPGDPSPTPDSPIMPHGQLVSRQRRISTGSSISERSSFSQDMDSPRVGIDERLSYPAPYPSPLHKSPSGASPIMASPRPDVSPKSTTYPAFNGQMRVGFYQDTVSTKSSPDKSCSPRDNPQSPYAQYSEHVYTPPTQNSTYSYGNPPCYSQSPCYSSQANIDASNNAYPYNKPQYPMKVVPNYANSPVSNTQIHSPQPNSPIPQQQMSPNLEHRMPEKQMQSAMFPVKKRAYNDNEAVGSPGRYEMQQQKNQQEQFVAHRNIDMNLMIGRHDLEQNQNSQHSLSPASVESPKSPYVHPNMPEQRQTPQTPQSIGEREQNQSEENQNSPQNNSYLSGTNYNFNSNVGYPLNIPSTRSLDTDRTIDMTKYNNMGYTGGDIGFQRTSPYARTDLSFARSTPTTAPIQSLPQTSTSNNQNLPPPNLVMRYTNPNVNYKQLNAANNNIPSPQLSTLNRTNILQPVQSTSEAMVSRLSQPLDVSSGYKPSDVNMPRPNYTASSLEMDQSLNLRGNIGNLSHIVDRFPSDDRMLGLQSTAQPFYPEKTLAPAHMLSKPIATSASGLPMFTQPNITIPYRDNMQEKSVSMPQVQEKKTKKRKSTKTATPPAAPTEATSNAPPISTTPSQQGFQSYAGLKNSTSSLEPSAISLKTTSVVPGSAFNFGPGPTGLGLGTGLYGDKDAYPNFLEDFRSTPNYYMAAAAAAHHRSTPETAEKPVRTAHQSTTNQAPPTYPFLGAPQPRPPSYPLGGAFMPPPPHQASLMDPSSPLYQQYLQAGVLHQGLLGPPGAYPAGYHHPALSMRQPYDSMTRPSWL
ncbi:hypothetical protein Trydic_g23942 [Trypoxylus dichotomus]